MPKTIKNNNEIDNIREDLKSLRDNVLVLSKKIEADGKVTAADLKYKAQHNLADLNAKAKENIAHLQDYSQDQLKHIEQEIKDKPARSVALAFGAGLLASFLFSRRG